MNVYRVTIDGESFLTEGSAPHVAVSNFLKGQKDKNKGKLEFELLQSRMTLRKYRAREGQIPTLTVLRPRGVVGKVVPSLEFHLGHDFYVTEGESFGGWKYNLMSFSALTPEIIATTEKAIRSLHGHDVNLKLNSVPNGGAAQWEVIE